jgi:hypothetical protein
MSKKKKRRPERPSKPACLEGKWHFDLDVPTYDFFEHQNLTRLRLRPTRRVTIDDVHSE